MSSTRGQQARNDSDYYFTPQIAIDRFLRAMLEVAPEFLQGEFLDPCAGGHRGAPMAYPHALERWGVHASRIETVDIRDDSPANHHADYLGWKAPKSYDVVITNPPFVHALPIIQRSLEIVKPGGYVVMLLRLNFLGTQDRFPFWSENLPRWIFVHSARLAFGNRGVTPDGEPEPMAKRNKKGTDSIEYAHFVWHRCASLWKYSELRVIR